MNLLPLSLVSTSPPCRQVARLAPLLLALVFILGACTGSDGDSLATNAGEATPTTADAAPTSAPPDQLTPAPTAAATTVAATPAPTTQDGTGVPDPDPGFEGTWLRVNGLGDHDFGAAQAAVLSSIEEVFGATSSLTEASECGAGPMTIASFVDFTVQFQDEQLIGWYYASSTPVLTTPSGVAVGISEAALEQVYQGLEISEGTLGREFVFIVPAGFMAGFIDQPGGIVESLYAGTNCFFR